MRGQRSEFICLFSANAAADIFYLYSKAHDIKSANADYIITRDERFLVEDSPVKAVSPFEFLNV